MDIPHTNALWNIIDLNGTVIALGFLIVLLVFTLLAGYTERKHERGVQYAGSQERLIPRTGDIMLSSLSFNRLRNLVAGELPAFWLATPANHAGLLYSPESVSGERPVYLMHRSNTGIRINLVTDYAQTYSIKILIRVEPAPPEHLILEGFNRQSQKNVKGMVLITLYFNWIARKICPAVRPPFYPDAMVSCSRTVMEALEYAGVCKCKVPLGTVIPHDFLFLNDPKRSIAEPIPPYRFLPPVWLNPFGTAAAVPHFDVQ